MTSAPETEESTESFAALFEGQEQPIVRRNLRVGDSFEGPVVYIGSDVVLIEIDGKRQGAIDSAELVDADGAMALEVGARVRAQVVAIDRDGNIKLGRQAQARGGIDAFVQARAAGLAVEGVVAGVNKGGLDVECGGVRAFCPMSQVDRFQVTDPSSFVGKTLRFAVTEIRGKNVVLSRRTLLEREAAEARDQTLATLRVGSELTGTIVRVKDFGAFVDLGGVEALLPAGDVLRDRKTKLESQLHPGETIEVVVRAIGEPEENRRGERVRKITLALRASSEEREALVDAAPRGAKGKRDPGQAAGSARQKQGFGTLGDLMAKLKK